jgi:hypothetical protein
LSSDPFLLAGRETISRSLDELVAALDGLPQEGLNWRPGPEDTNSIAVLVTHALNSTRSWLCVAFGFALPKRTRDDEFVASAGWPVNFRLEAEGLAQDCRQLLEQAAEVDWSAIRQTHARPNPVDPDHVPAAWALLHGVEHLREHLGQVLLTRQLYLAERRADG